MIRHWDPFREMMVLRNSMDRGVDRDLALAPASWKSFNWSVALDVVESEDEYLVKASLPGINPEDLNITFDDNRLTLKGEVKGETEVPGTRLCHHARRVRAERTTAQDVRLGLRQRERPQGSLQLH